MVYWRSYTPIHTCSDESIQDNESRQEWSRRNRYTKRRAKEDIRNSKRHEKKSKLSIIFE